jgi:tetratricopeptide (TPR) repeat protein
MFYRAEYLRHLVHVSIVSVDSTTQVIVHREGGTKSVSRPEPRKGGEPPEEGGNEQTSTIIDGDEKGERSAQEGAGAECTPPGAPIVYGGRAEDLTDLIRLLKDAAFMVMQARGLGYEGRDCEGMRHYSEGLEELNDYRRTAIRDHLDRAKEEFRRAVDRDGKHYEALHFYASLLLLDRTRESIDRAKMMFQQIIEGCRNGFLRAFAYAGCAQCNAQEHHRLAKRGKSVMDQAKESADEAVREWREAVKESRGAKEGKRSPQTRREPEEVHPWIRATCIFVRHIDEGSEAKRPKSAFLGAANDYLPLLAEEPDDARLQNIVGWTMLKLAEWKVKDTKRVKGVNALAKELKGDPAVIAERFFLNAIDLNPKNKLAHANLCLLYATDHYLKQKEEKKKEESFRRCRFHGLKAVSIDREYVNGYRDLALGLLKYDHEQEARKYFTRALQLALVIDKDLELLADAERVLKSEEVNADAKTLDRWLNPDRKLFEPEWPAPGWPDEEEDDFLTSLRA